MKKLILLFTAILFFTGCKTTEKSSYVEQHRIEDMMAKMDSVINKSQTTIQDTSWHETVIKELQSIKERNDTSRVVVVDSAGKVIKEVVTIVREREVERESDRQEREGMIHKMEKMDSTLSVANQQISHMDSLLKEREKETVIEKQQPWYLQLWNGIKLLLIGAVIGIVLMLTKNIWIKIFKH